VCQVPGCVEPPLAKGRCRGHALPAWAGSYERRSRSLPNRKLLQLLKARVKRRARGRCERCGQHSRTLVVDHRQPLALGGETTLANLWALCVSCDAAKTRADLALMRELDEALRDELAGRRERER
jgi:5-methylcytosine-specific restriction protein A